MKTILYSLIALISFASCEKNDIPPNDPFIPDTVYEFNIRMIESADVDSLDMLINVHEGFNNSSFPDAPWTITFGSFLSNSPINQSIAFPIDNIGDFDFAFTYEWQTGTTDSIYGSGYIDADTFYMHYTYIDIEAGYTGDVEIHSL